MWDWDYESETFSQTVLDKSDEDDNSNSRNNQQNEVSAALQNAR